MTSCPVNEHKKIKFSSFTIRASKSMSNMIIIVMASCPVNKHKKIRFSTYLILLENEQMYNYCHEDTFL